MTLSDPNPGFKVTRYLKVEYLADGARVFNCTKHMSGSELLGKPVSEVLEWLFPLFDDLTQLLCKRDDVATVF